MSIVGSNPDAVIGGVDTHVEVHVVAAVNHVGGVLGVESFPTTRSGYRQLVSWLRSFGELILVGVLILLILNPLLAITLITVFLYILHPTPTLTVAAIAAEIFIYLKLRRKN